MQETFRRVGMTVEALLTVYDNLVQANVSIGKGKSHIYSYSCTNVNVKYENNTVCAIQPYTTELTDVLIHIA